MHSLLPLSLLRALPSCRPSLSLPLSQSLDLSLLFSLSLSRARSLTLTRYTRSTSPHAPQRFIRLVRSPYLFFYLSYFSEYVYVRHTYTTSEGLSLSRARLFFSFQIPLYVPRVRTGAHANSRVFPLFLSPHRLLFVRRILYLARALTRTCVNAPLRTRYTRSFLSIFHDRARAPESLRLHLLRNRPLCSSTSSCFSLNTLL